MADALAIIRHRWSPVLIGVTAGDGAHVTVLQAVPLPDATGAEDPGHESSDLRGRTAEAGMRIEIDPRPKSVRIS